MYLCDDMMHAWHVVLIWYQFISIYITVARSSPQ